MVAGFQSDIVFYFNSVQQDIFNVGHRNDFPWRTGERMLKLNKLKRKIYNTSVFGLRFLESQFCFHILTTHEILDQSFCDF